MTSVPPASRLASSWVDNADAWTAAVRTGAIPSRRAGTDAAILQAIARAPMGPLLDVGCGEGWMARAVAAEGRRVVGVDSSPPLIEAARQASPFDGPRFEHATYAALSERSSELGGPFAVAVCNFALLDQNLAEALTAIRATLSCAGVLLIQTVHPFTACGDGVYENAWREETFDAFGGSFPSPMPWYFRTIASWLEELHSAGFVLESITEPMAPGGVRPLSLLIRARRSD
jgi:2-polyprenyl-3-methyl-5-hydroxy-6-metoxy-1,4-benzoquinol methylase